MTQSDLTIPNVIKNLEKEFGPFRIFQDVPAAVLDAELAGEAGLDTLPQIARKATNKFTDALAA